MKKYLLTVLLVIFAFVARAQNDGDIIKVGDQMPAFTIVSDEVNNLVCFPKRESSADKFLCNLVSSLSERTGGSTAEVVAEV